jgi:Holliday junction resolvase|tara:strand:+ start:254 stop:493 length:240 start_codon:yes stop_codon:yes gene_type:complete
MTEQQIQKKRIDQLEKEGYYVLKLIKTNKNGIPDLIAIGKNSDVLFSEIKGANGKVSALQQYRMKELNKHGLKTEIYKG